MARPRTSRLYARRRNGTARWWADFRDYADVGGKQEPLVEQGQAYATTDRARAELLAAERLRELEQFRAGHGGPVAHRRPTLAEAAREHLINQKKRDAAGDQWLKDAETHLTRAIEFFGANTDPAKIKPADVGRWIEHLSRMCGRGRNEDGSPRTMSKQTQLHHINSLSRLYGRLHEELQITGQYNPVALLKDKPSVVRDEAAFLELDVVGLLLKAARAYVPENAHGFRYALPLLATFVYTGAREEEVLTLSPDAWNLTGRITTIERQARKGRRRVRYASRPVPMSSEYVRIMKAYLTGANAPKGRFAFPSPKRPDAAVTEIRSLLDKLVAKALELATTDAQRRQLTSLVIRTKIFRHTYCAARLQTLDGGEAISKFTVATELGHSATRLVDRVYGHVQNLRRRYREVTYEGATGSGRSVLRPRRSVAVRSPSRMVLETA